MKVKGFFSILHFSDLHFGEFSMQSDKKRPGVFDNYFTRFQIKVDNILNNENVDLVIITGDFCSRNLFTTKGKKQKKIKRRKPLEIPTQLRSFLDNFKKKKIPIVICIGNHEIDREREKHEDRTFIFRELKNLIKDYMNSDFSINFDQNLINYKIYENERIIIFSIDTTSSLRDKHWKDSTIDLQEIIEFLNELESKGVKDSNFKKILICHHPLREIRNLEDIEPYLVENNILLIFSGHLHDRNVDFLYYIGGKKIIINLIAGSPFLNLEKRSERKTVNPANFQFNFYVLSGSNWGGLSGDYYIYNDNNIWEKKNLILPSNPSRIFLNWLERIIEETRNHPSEERIKILKEKGNQSEVEELEYISWVFNDFTRRYLFELKEIKLICKYFKSQVEKFFSYNQNLEIIEEVLKNASIEKEETSIEFLENLKQGKKIWLGTVQDFNHYLKDVFNLSNSLIEKTLENSFKEMVIEITSKTIPSEPEEKIEKIKYIENYEIIKSTLEVINDIFSNKIKDFKFRKKIFRELGIDVKDLHEDLLLFAAKSFASSLLDYDGVFLFKWREKLHKLILEYVNNLLKDMILRRSSLNNYIEMISDYALILAKDDIEMVI